ncbi:MAG: T9SS type A sorting domain-containing protein [Bacteroidetes bacterium]|nr:T9SS type A sorting domain-containing protein [Bacteroidota bacterium]
MRKRNSLLLVVCLLFTYFFIAHLQSAVAQSFSYCPGDTFFLTLPEYRGELQWQESNDSISWTDIPGATIQPYRIIFSSPAYYRAQVAEGTCDTVYSPVTHVLQKTWLCGLDGNLHIQNGETVDIAVGSIKDYNNLTIDSGGTLRVTGNAIDFTMIGVKGNLILNGTIEAKNSTASGNTSVTAPDGTVLSSTIVQQPGGNGGNGGEISTLPGGAGGAESNGDGGGGGSGSTFFQYMTYEGPYSTGSSGLAAGSYNPTTPLHSCGTDGANGNTQTGFTNTVSWSNISSVAGNPFDKLDITLSSAFGDLGVNAWICLYNPNNNPAVSEVAQIIQMNGNVIRVNVPRYSDTYQYSGTVIYKTTASTHTAGQGGLSTYCTNQTQNGARGAYFGSSVGYGLPGGDRLPGSSAGAGGGGAKGLHGKNLYIRCKGIIDGTDGLIDVSGNNGGNGGDGGEIITYVKVSSIGGSGGGGAGAGGSAGQIVIRHCDNPNNVAPDFLLAGGTGGVGGAGGAKYWTTGITTYDGQNGGNGTFGNAGSSDIAEYTLGDSFCVNVPFDIYQTTLPAFSVISSNVQNCIGFPAKFFITASGDSLTYHWYHNSVQIPAETGDTISFSSITPADAGEYYCIASNCAGSDTSDVAILTVYPLPLASAGGNQSVCYGSSATLEASGGTSYCWNTGENTSWITVPTDTASIHWVTVTNEYGCTAVDTAIISILPNDFDVTFSQSTQFPSPPNFTVIFTNTTPSSYLYNFYWYLGDGTVDSTNSNPVAHNYLHNGLYTVSLLAKKNTTGCIDTLYKYNWITCGGGSLCGHTAVIPVANPLLICEGDSALFECNTDPDFSYQWNIYGVTIPGATQSSYYATQEGDYSVTIIKDDCAVTSNTIETHFLESPEPPLISASGSLDACSGGADTLNASGGYTAYLWSTGDTAQTIVVTESGEYSVKGFNDLGCGTNSLPFIVNASLIQSPEICLITVDSATNKNKIQWYFADTSAISSFSIYKETSFNQYDSIGNVQAGSVSEFIDYFSDPDLHSNRYKIAATDTCEGLSNKGPYHETVNLSVSQGIPWSTMSLHWNTYKDESGAYTPGYYYIYRGAPSNEFDIIDSVSGSVSQYNDPNIFGVYLYKIGYRRICEAPVISFSNTKDNSIIVGQQNSLNKENLIVYPNPFSSQTTISFEKPLTEYRILITDVTGKVVFEDKNASGEKYVLQRGTLESGMYLLEISNEEFRMTRKLVVE